MYYDYIRTSFELSLLHVCTQNNGNDNCTESYELKCNYSASVGRILFCTIIAAFIGDKRMRQARRKNHTTIRFADGYKKNIVSRRKQVSEIITRNSVCSFLVSKMFFFSSTSDPAPAISNTLDFRVQADIVDIGSRPVDAILLSDRISKYIYRVF